MSGSKNYFYLLPPEVTQGIFNSVQAQEKPLLVPLSKHLLPFQQRPLFYHIVLDSYGDLEMLCDMTRKRSALATYIDHLHINIDPTFVPGQEVPTESDDPLVPSSGQLQALYQSLTNVTTLSIFCSHRLVTSILTQELTPDYFPKLHKLCLTSSFPQFEDPFDPAHYTVLPNLPKLKSFLLTVFCAPHAVRPNPQITTLTVPFSSQLENLRLCGPLMSSASSTKLLIESSSSITSLALIDTFGKSQVTELLDGLQRRDNLLELTLDRSPVYGLIPLSSLVEALSRCPNLQSLTLGGSCSSTSPSLYSALLDLPLRSHIFSYDAQVSLDQLARLVTGSTKHSTLRSMTFENLSGKIGTTIEEAGQPYAGPHGNGCDVYPDWILPEWTEDFTRKGLIEFLKIADFEGVHVEGFALEAIRVEMAYERELDIIKAMGEDDYSE
ncbi:hypothetical protein JCM5353_006582 [Sporobolomyces roseus]